MDNQLLRFTTAGSVDDGKSTLIGRLLFDTKSIFEDQLQAITAASQRRGEDTPNLALLTDGLKSEREQGITIDVAYRYFSTPKRKFIIADTPGHIQYTRNMITGASTANLALILIDARKGIVEQTRRHAFIASLLQIPHLVFCINKMDLVDYRAEIYEQLREELDAFSAKLKVADITFIPISALKGDNIVSRSENMPWYQGPTLLYFLENVHISSDQNLIDVRLPIQMVIRPNTDAYHDFRGYAGQIASGIIRRGDEVMVLPSGFLSTIKGIYLAEREMPEAFAPMSVTVTLEDEIDLGRGGMIVRANNYPKSTQDHDLMVCWFDHQPGLTVGKKLLVRHTSNEVKCVIKKILYKMDINSLHRNQHDLDIRMNDIARIIIRTTQPLFTDPYSRNRITGSLILIDEKSNNTVAAGLVI